MTDIKIKKQRYADKENLKKLMRYSKNTFANKSEINEKFYTKEQIDTKLEGISGGGGSTGGGTPSGDYYTKSEIDTKLDLKANTSDLSNYYTKPEVDNLLSNISPITSAITIYDLVPDGAEAHNSMWGGRDITAAFNSGEFSEHVADGTFKGIFPGDYIWKQVTIGGAAYSVTWVVADCDYWINKGYDGATAIKTHHVVIVPQDSIYVAQMNGTNTTEGGYKGSDMYRNIIPSYATGIVNAFGSSHILTFKDSITKAVSSGASSDWSWYDAQCNLMCERMVYGMPAFSSSGWDAGVATRQFSAFRLSEKLINYDKQRSYWLRDVVSSTHFAVVSAGGIAYSYEASNVYTGVRPFALLR